MSVFDGLAGVLAVTLGAPVTITRAGHGAVTLQAVFREDLIEQAAGDGRIFVGPAPTVKVRTGDIAALAKGDLVAPAATSPRTFTVLQTYPATSPGADAFITYLLEEVRP